jgi:hypothetical protein
MTITQTVEIPADHRITFEIPQEIPVGTITRVELIFSPHREVTDSAIQQRRAENRTPISQYFNILSPDTYGDGVAYQRKLRNEWDD